MEQDVKKFINDVKGEKEISRERLIGFLFGVIVSTVIFLCSSCAVFYWLFKLGESIN